MSIKRDRLGYTLYPIPKKSFSEFGNESFIEGTICNTNIYINFPYCDGICSFCNCGIIGHDEEVTNDYVNLLISEIKKFRKVNERIKFKINTIGFGGGTPSKMSSKNINMIIEELNSSFNLSEVTEITIECRDLNINKQYLEDIVCSGVNRISMGVQTLDNKLRKEQNLITDSNFVIRKVELIASIINNYNLDFIYNLPNQNINDVEKELEKIEKLNVPHLTYNHFNLIPGTSVAKKFIIDNEHLKIEMEMYKLIQSKLLQNGYENYTSVDFSKQGYYSHSILNRYKGQNIISFGARAFSFVENISYINEMNVSNYELKVKNNLQPISKYTSMTQIDMMKRQIIQNINLGEFTLSDIVDSSFRSKLIRILESLNKNRLVSLDNNTVRLTQLGKYYMGNIKSTINQL